jgi:methyl-accepting chemotaxis protein
MEIESAPATVVPRAPGAAAATGGAESEKRPADNALMGWLMVAGLVAAAYVLLSAGAKQGGPSWPRDVFLGAGIVALIAYGPIVFGFFRRLERRLPVVEVRRERFEETLSVAFGQLETGDLVRAVEQTRGLPERLAEVFKAAAEALATLALQIQDSSVEVASAAASVRQIASELASGAAQQAASVVEITAAMEELARTAAQIAESASLQANLAARSEASGDSGAAAVGEAVAGVEEVQKRIGAISSRADALGTRSKEIYRVLDLITEIAQETHILSLNAAIEAAAAGANGRRFSVVAEEVRRLAKRSQESVESVRNLLDEFSGSVRATIVATEEGSKEAIRVLERSRTAAAAIAELRRAAGDAARVARQISLATQQQNSASDEVVMTLREVGHVVQRMTGGLQELSATADRLNSLGLTIQLLAQSFHLDSPRSLKHMAERWARDVEPLMGDRRLEEKLGDLLKQAPFVEKAYVVDSRGDTTALCFSRAVGEEERQAVLRAMQSDKRERPWYKAVARGWRTALTHPYQSIEDGEPVFTVGTPMRDALGALTGVLAIDIKITGWMRI